MTNNNKINVEFVNFPSDGGLNKKLIKGSHNRNGHYVIEVKEKGFWTWIDRIFTYLLGNSTYNLVKINNCVSIPQLNIKNEDYEKFLKIREVIQKYIGTTSTETKTDLALSDLDKLNISRLNSRESLNQNCNCQLIANKSLLVSPKDLLECIFALGLKQINACAKDVEKFLDVIKNFRDKHNKNDTDKYINELRKEISEKNIMKFNQDCSKSKSNNNDNEKLQKQDVNKPAELNPNLNNSQVNRAF